MANKLLSIEIQGKEKKWSFPFYADEKYIPEWEADGLDVSVIENTIPQWAVDVGLLGVWCFTQDLLNFRNPFRYRKVD